MNNYFNLKRFGLLFLKEVWINKKNIPIMFFSLIILFLLLDFSLLNEFFEKKFLLRHSELYPFVVLIYCMVITSTSFAELNSSDRKIDFMMLPASAEEKFLVKLFYTSVVFIIISIAALSISALIVEAIRIILKSEVLFKRILYLYPTYMLLSFVKTYIALHAIFFLGAVFFKKLEFGKTILAILTITAAAVLYLLILNYVPVFKNVISQKVILAQFGIVDSQLSADSMKNSIGFFRQVIHDLYFVFSYILPFVFWGTAYLRFKEEEVDNGF